MRLSYQDGKFYCTFTDDEHDKMEKHKPLELNLGLIKVLHDDISLVSSQQWKYAFYADKKSQKNKSKKIK